MFKRNSKLTGKTIVVTGASSGIGKAIALTLAKDKVNLVLAARRDALLQEVASECESLGSEAIAVKTDVTIYDDVINLYEKALSFFGKIDVWINDAGVGAVGNFTDTPMGAHEQVIKTNLLAYMYGAHAVLPHFKERKKGTLINIVSAGAYVPSPFAVAYSASKFGLRGFSESLRDEIQDLSNIHICDVNPAFINTPGPIHAANYIGKELRPATPTYDPFKVAQVVKSLILKPRSNVMVGSAAWAARIAHALAPRLVGKAMSKFAIYYFKKAKDVPVTNGNLWRPIPTGKESRGGYYHH
ncbi:MAG: SDR family oxidoreductase [Bacteriovoracaceae bacterium]